MTHFVLFLVAVLLCGCASPGKHPPAPARLFDFQKDTFAFANELVWVYEYDSNGNWTTHNRDPKPTYSLHCFVLARSARQFFLNARFDPSLPVANEASYRHLIRQVVAGSPRKGRPEDRKIVIPGYADLRSFSRENENLLKSECGGGWQSYFQRGHWRMIFPFSRSHQVQTAEHLSSEVTNNPPAVVHIVRFPSLSINHALVLFDAKQSETRIEFGTYDPNRPDKPTVLTYDRATRTFLFPPNDYFQGGRVDIYEVYHKWDY